MDFTKFNFYTRILIAIGSLNYLVLAVFKHDMFSFIVANPDIIRLIVLLIAFAGITQTFNRNYFLPFLGATVMPPFPLLENPGDVKATVTNLKPNSLVVYWAASSNNKVQPDYNAGYDKYQNMGVVRTNTQGQATLNVQCPANYQVGEFYKKTLPQHIHYRYELQPGMYSSVHTINIEC